jgi:hypothetical protein
MPQGKGTYGSQVGRPSKKKKYQVGGKVKPNFPQENPAIAEANKMGQELKSIPLENMESELPTANAMERSKVSPIGKEVGTGVYKEGGFIKKTVDKIKDKKRMKKLEKSLKGANTPKGHQEAERELAYLKQKGKKPTHEITGIVMSEKKGLKPAKVSSNPPLFKGDTFKEKVLNTSILYNMGKKATKKKRKKKK